MSKKHNDMFMPAASTFIVGAMFAYCLHRLLTTEAPAGNHDALMLLIGALGVQFANCIGFWINSSQGSRIKDRATDSKAGGNNVDMGNKGGAAVP